MSNYKNNLFKASISIFLIFLVTVTIANASEGINFVYDYAGTGNAGYLNGEASKATFSLPYGLAIDKDGGLLVVDTNSNRIRKVYNNNVITLAGYSAELDSYNFPKGGYVDGQALKAMFDKPRYVAVDSKGVIYISDTGNNVIRKIVNGKVYTVAGSREAGYQDGAPSEARFNMPTGLALDKNDDLYVADSLNHVIRKIAMDGTVSTFAGAADLLGGYKDGKLKEAQFYEPSDIAFDQKGELYVMDTGNQVIRKITNDSVTSVCGFKDTPISDTNYSVGGHTDGYGTDVRFNFAKGMCISENGTIFIADTWNNLIRIIKPDGEVSTIAGNGTAGKQNGIYKEAMFNGPLDVAYSDGKLYISDMWNNSIRIMYLDVDKLPKIVNSNTPGIATKFFPKTKQVQLWIDKKFIGLYNSPSNVNGSNIMVSLEQVCRVWKAKVQYYPATKTATIIKGSIFIKLTLGKDTLIVKNNVLMMDARTLAKKLNLGSYWRQDINAMLLYTNQN